MKFEVPYKNAKYKTLCTCICLGNIMLKINSLKILKNTKTASNLLCSETLIFYDINLWFTFGQLT